jgi:hypothetical protein
LKIKNKQYNRRYRKKGDECEDNKGVNRSRKLKDRQCNDRNSRQYNDLNRKDGEEFEDTKAVIRSRKLNETIQWPKQTERKRV